jgi:5-methylthioadenosine/S-adenosylhomocysteine deaminase
LRFVVFFDAALQPDRELMFGVRIEIADGQIVRLEYDRVPSRGDIVVKGICLPSFVNSHDHLKYTWPERIGGKQEGCFYSNSYEWLPVLYREAELKFLRVIAVTDLYWLGVYKSVFSGTSTVVNHARRLPLDFSALPIRIFKGFAREIFVRTDPRAHPMGFGLAEEIALSGRGGIPLVVHVSEGTDGLTRGEVKLLADLGGLSARSVLVHCINVSRDEIDIIAEARASVVWCPSANAFLFGRTAPIFDLLDAGINVALGTDSSCTGFGDLFDEMRLAAEFLAPRMSKESVARSVLNLVTTNPARAFHKEGRWGVLEVGACADLLVVPFRNNPWDDVLSLRFTDILLLTYRGRWVFGRSNIVKNLACVNAELERFGQCSVAGRPSVVLNRVSQQCGRTQGFFPLGEKLCALTEESGDY